MTSGNHSNERSNPIKMAFSGMKSVFFSTMLSILFLLDGHTTRAQTTVQLNGNNVCTATFSRKQMQKVPITGIQTKIVRYVTRCGFGLTQCSRYRTIYVPAYREMMTTGYRSKNVCCAGNVAVNGQCVPHVATTPDPSRRDRQSSKPTPNRPKMNPSYPANPGRGGKQGGVDVGTGRRPTQGTAPFVPFSRGGTGGVGFGQPGGSDSDAEGGLAAERPEYDKSPDVHSDSDGSGMISLTLGVGVCMSLTGMLVGALLMKMRARNGKAMDGMPLTRSANSRRTTKKTARSVSGRVSRKSQNDRVVSYVDIMEIRERMPITASSPEAKRRIIPQVSLPGIPEATAEYAESADMVDQKNDTLLELKELKPAAGPFPPYASVVRKSKRKGEPSQIGNSERDMEQCGEDRASIPNVDTTSQEEPCDETRGSGRENTRRLYASINKNENHGQSEHRDKESTECPVDVVLDGSHESSEPSPVTPKSGTDDQIVSPPNEDIYGELDRSLSRSADDLVVSRGNFKYDRLKRSPKPRSSRRKKGYSELYESI